MVTFKLDLLGYFTKTQPLMGGLAISSVRWQSVKIKGKNWWKLYHGKSIFIILYRSRTFVCWWWGWFQIYRYLDGMGQYKWSIDEMSFHWWRKLEYPEETTGIGYTEPCNTQTGIAAHAPTHDTPYPTAQQPIYCIRPWLSYMILKRYHLFTITCVLRDRTYFVLFVHWVIKGLGMSSRVCVTG